MLLVSYHSGQDLSDLRMSRAALSNAMAAKYQLDVADELVTQGWKTVRKGYAKAADKGYELSRFKEPLDRIHDALKLAQEVQPDGIQAEWMKFCNVVNLTGQSLSLFPFHNEASDLFALEYDNLINVLTVQRDALIQQDLARSKFHGLVRDLNAFGTVQVAKAESAQFVKDFTSCRVTYSPELTPLDIENIRAAVNGIQGIEVVAAN